MLCKLMSIYIFTGKDLQEESTDGGENTRTMPPYATNAQYGLTTHAVISEYPDSTKLVPRGPASQQARRIPTKCPRGLPALSGPLP